MIEKTDHIEYEMLLRLNMGDEEAFIFLYDQYHAKLYNYIFHFVKSTPASEDILQDVFIKIWEARERINPERGATAYFHRVARNTIYSFLTNMNRRKELETELVNADDSFSHADDSFADNLKQFEAVLYAAINELPEKRKKIFKLVRMEGRSYEEVAGQLGISRNTVKEHLVLALKFVKKRVQDAAKRYPVIFVLGIFTKF